MLCFKLTLTPTLVRSGTKTPEEVDAAAALTTEATAIAVTITETNYLQTMNLKEK